MYLQRATYPLMGLMLCFVVTGCSRESKQQQPVTTATGSKTSTAPASGAAAAQQDQALVRVVNAVPDKPALDVIAKDAEAFQRVSYKTVTPYREIPADVSKFSIKAAGEQAAEPLTENRENIVSGRHYTLVVFPDKDHADKADLKVISDDQEPSSSGKARLRVINASPDVNKIAVYVSGTKDALFSGVDFREAASYKEVGPGEVTLELRNDAGGLTKNVPDATTARMGKTSPNRNDTDMTLATQHINLEPGKTYTIILAGHTSLADRTAPANRAANDRRTGGLDVIVVEDTVPQQPARTE